MSTRSPAANQRIAFGIAQQLAELALREVFEERDRAQREVRAQRCDGALAVAP